jgi:hypothetical protein
MQQIRTFTMSAGVCAGELGADLVGVRVLQVLEDGQCLLPGLPGLRQLADGLVGVAEEGEGLGFNPAVPHFSGDTERSLIARGGLGEVA